MISYVLLASLFVEKTKSYFGTPLVGTLNLSIDGRGNSCGGL